MTLSEIKVGRDYITPALYGIDPDRVTVLGYQDVPGYRGGEADRYVWVRNSKGEEYATHPTYIEKETE